MFDIIFQQKWIKTSKIWHIKCQVPWGLFKFFNPFVFFLRPDFHTFNNFKGEKIPLPTKLWRLAENLFRWWKLFNDHKMKILTKQNPAHSKAIILQTILMHFNFLAGSNKFELVVRNQYSTQIKLYPTLPAPPIETFLELNLAEIIKNLLFIPILQSEVFFNQIQRFWKQHEDDSCVKLG